MVLLSACLSLISCQARSTSTTEPVETQTNQSTKTIVIGDISNNPAKKIARYQPMADYLASNLSEFGIGRGEVKVASDLATMIDWLKSGQVDIYFDSPYPSMIVGDRSGSTPILRRWKGGQSDYYGVFFAMNSSGIKTLADLKGKVVAFDEPYSTSGYFLPLVKLIESGFKVVETTFSNTNISQEQIGYVFTDDDENTIQWVISGKVDAGVVDLETFEEIPSQSRIEIKILAKTKTVPRQMVSIRKDLDPELRETIQTLLLNMDQNEESKQVLTKFENTAKFDDFPTQQSIDEIRRLYELIPAK
ncbi:MAG: phosphate/phosphite/phosphonate ABC transporter substrate-binding protein [Xenococcaceae cyanobacterium MO_188.B29]|nr:phosphate/phosphite/phosphonate ABC transporter substrate-binding protein [Xenococcaceae cyanobacterium MO_188.B29]